MTSVLAHRIECVVYRSPTRRFLDLCPNDFVTFAIVDYRVILLAIDESFDEGAAFASYRDKRVDIRKPGKFNRKGSNCGRAAVYN
jgi:hypothetical protein